MGGSKRGKIECFINTGNRNTHAQVYFKNLYDFFTSHPQYTLVASNYGWGGPGTTGSGNGTNYYDQANSFAYDAWFIVKQNSTTVRPFDVYHLFQWSGSSVNTSSSLGTLSSSAPALINGAQNYLASTFTQVGYACAIGVGGSPYLGLGGFGNGIKSTAAPTPGAVWITPQGGQLYTFPKSNSSPLGTHWLQKQNMMLIFGNGNTDVWQTRQNIIADDDSFVILTDVSNTGVYSLTYSGIFTPRSNLPSGSVPYPYCVISTCNNTLPFSYTSVYGDAAGTSAQQGGIASPLYGSTAALLLDHYSTNFQVDANFWPDKQTSGTTYLEYPLLVCASEVMAQNTGAGISDWSAFLGQVDFIHEVYNIATNDVRTDYSRIFVGSATLASTHYAIPWDSATSTVPGSGTTRQGVTFVSNN